MTVIVSFSYRGTVSVSALAGRVAAAGGLRERPSVYVPALAGSVAAELCKRLTK